MRPPHFKQDKILFYNHPIFQPLFISSFDIIKSLCDIKEFNDHHSSFNNIDNQIFILSFINQQIPMFDIKMNNDMNNYNNYQNIADLIVPKYQYQSESQRLLIDLNNIQLSPLSSHIKNKKQQSLRMNDDNEESNVFDAEIEEILLNIDNEEYIENVADEWLNQFVQTFNENDCDSPYFFVQSIPKTFIHGGCDF